MKKRLIPESVTAKPFEILSQTFRKFQSISTAIADKNVLGG
jgi:hypothetical protein